MKVSRRVDLDDPEGDGLRLPLRLIDDDLHDARTDALPLERRIKVNLFEEYFVIVRRRLQPSGILPGVSNGDRGDADFFANFSGGYIGQQSDASTNTDFQ
jgi:hypothetical protein